MIHRPTVSTGCGLDRLGFKNRRGVGDNSIRLDSLVTIFNHSLGHFGYCFHILLRDAFCGNIIGLDRLGDIDIVRVGRVLLEHLIEGRALGIGLVVGTGRRGGLFKRSLGRGGCDGG